MPMACSGWRRSWLAAAKNCVFERVAFSASRRASSAMRFSFSNCSTSTSFS